MWYMPRDKIRSMCVVYAIPKGSLDQNVGRHLKPYTPGEVICRSGNNSCNCKFWASFPLEGIVEKTYFFATVLETDIEPFEEEEEEKEVVA